MYRWEVINREIKLNNYNSYLEIGVLNGSNFKRIKAKDKIGVDPDAKSFATHKMTSDAWFEQNRKEAKPKTFDIVFIDGLHEADQVYKDICNSVEFLNEGGTIVMHDMLPTTEDEQKVPRVQDTWTGDCWRAFAKWRKENWGKHRSFTIDTDWGIGVIKLQPTNAKCKIPEDVEYNWETFTKHKKNLLSVISWDEYIRRAR